MDWENLKVFLGVAESGSLAGAARRLKVSQATVWRRIRTLEHSLGVDLFQRQPSGYVLTGAGTTFLKRTIGLRRVVEVACQQVSDQEHAIEGEVRVTAPEFVGVLIAERLPELARLHPRLVIELLTGSPAAGLLARDADIALRAERISTAGFALEAVFSVPCGLYASAAYLKRHGAPRTLDELGGHRLIDFDHSMAHVAPRKWERADKKGAVIAFRSNSPHGRLAAARSGIGLAMLCEPLVRDYSGLRLVLPSDVVGTLELMMFVSSELRREARVTAVRDFLGRLFPAEPRARARADRAAADRSAALAR